MKLSLHIGAKGEAFSTGHNDGEMYGFSHSSFEKGRPENSHWDPWNKNLKGLEKVGKTREAVARWREETLRPEFARLLNSDGWKQHPDRRKTWEEFVESGELAPREAILQVGDKDEFPAPQCLLEAVRAFQTQLDVSGLSIIAVDFHLDEATPHAHVLFAADVNRGRLDYNGTLEKAGVKRPKKGKRGQRNNEFMAFTSNARQACEDAADGWLVAHGQKKLDRERDKKAVHRSNKQFKSDMRKAEKQLAEQQVRLAEVSKAVKSKEDEFDDLDRAVMETIKDMDRVRRKREVAVKDLKEVESNLAERKALLGDANVLVERIDDLFQATRGHETVDFAGNRETLSETFKRALMTMAESYAAEGDKNTASTLLRVSNDRFLYSSVEQVVSNGFAEKFSDFAERVKERIRSFFTAEKQNRTALDEAVADVAWNELLRAEQQRLFGSQGEPQEERHYEL